MTAVARPAGAMSVADVERFEHERPRLVGLAYRLLGSLADAEDVVQEAWLRWQQTDRDAIEQPAAWLTTVTSRIGLDRLRARQRDRADYVGPWLPEPIVVPMDAADPAHHAELSDSLTTAFLVLLEELSPTERLVLLLADVFDQPFAEISAILGRSSDACRQVASRARRKVREAEAPRRGRGAAADAAALAAAGAFVDAARRGDQQALLELLAPDAVLVSDGGAEQHAARRPCRRRGPGVPVRAEPGPPAAGRGGGRAVLGQRGAGQRGLVPRRAGVHPGLRGGGRPDQPHLHREQPRQAARPGPHGPAGLRSTVGPETRGACAGVPFPTVGRSGQDSLTRVASGLLAGAVVAVLGACALIWWYRQAAFGWSAPNPRFWRLLELAAIGLAHGRARAGRDRCGAPLHLVRPGRRHHVGRGGGRHPRSPHPSSIGRQAPKGRHAVVVAVDAATGDVRWRVTTPGWSLRALAITGDVVTMLTVGGDTEPCRDVLRRLTLGVAEGTTLSLENRSTSAPQYPPSDYTVRDGYLIHLDGATEGWRVALAPLGVSRAGYVVAGSGVVVVSSDGELPLKCHT